MPDTTAKVTNVADPDSVHEVPVFLCYRRSDGSWAAEWLNDRLDGAEYIDRDGRRSRLVVYYDKTAPGVADWKSLHFPSLQTARALLVICTPGMAKDFSRRGQPDWVYEELRWWVGNRDTAPIVIDATGEGDRWLPELVTKKWPDINRIDLVQRDAEHAAATSDHEFDARIRHRIIGAIRESEHQTLFEELERSQRQERRLRWAFGIASVLLVLAVVAGYYARVQRQEAIAQQARAEEQARIAQERRLEAIAQQVRAEEQARIAQERLALLGELANRLLDPGGSGTSNTGVILKLLDEVIRRTNEMQFMIVSLDVLSCWGPYTGTALGVTFEKLFSRLDSVADEDVRARVRMLRANVEAERSGKPRPYPCQMARRG